MKRCPKCKGLRFVVKNGEKVPCSCARARLLKSYAPDLVSAAIRVGKKNRARHEGVFKGKPRCFMQLPAMTPIEQAKTMALYFLLAQGSPTFVQMNVYELIEIYLGRHPEFSSIYQLKFPACILYQGYNEFENKRQNDAILQFLDIAASHNSKMLYLCLKSSVDTLVLNYVQTHDWQVVKSKGKSKYEAV